SFDKRSLTNSLDKIESIDQKITKIKSLKKNKISQHTHQNAGEILNKVIENITSQLFTNANKDKDREAQFDNNEIHTHSNLNDEKNSQEDFEIRQMPKNKTKIFKLRASSAPKKKITSFEEFLQTAN